MNKIYYDYIIQEKIEDCWFDKYVSTDRKMVEEVIKVFRKKYVNCKFRVVRLVI